MIENKSRKTSGLQESRVKIDILERGWIVMDAPAEAPYDLVVDMGLEHYGKRIFWSIQVKEELRTTNRPVKKNMSIRDGDCNWEPVSKGGKGRNWYYYYDKDVTLLASYDEKLGRVKYVHKDQYRYCTPGELKKVNEFNYPVNELMYSYKKPTTVFTAAKPTVKVPSISIENFL
tara:strand:- start:42 stop:563 length:522 start_codon:yes stop_codon:yes gene_type:complete